MTLFNPIPDNLDNLLLCFLFAFVPAALLGAFLWLTRTTSKHLARLQAQAQERGWQYKRDNQTDYALQGTNNGVRWEVTGVNYGLKVMWQTADAPPAAARFNIYNRRTVEAAGFDFSQRVGKFFMPTHFSGREQILSLGSAAFRERYAVVSDDPEVAEALFTAVVEELFVRYPASKELGLNYHGRVLYLTAVVQGVSDIYDIRLINTMIRAGTTIVQEWTQTQA